MSKQIRVEDHVHRDLDNFRDKHESFSQAVERLLNAASLITQFKMVIEGGIAYEKWRKSVKMEKELEEEQEEV